MNWKDRIVVDPETSSGKPVIKGTRLPAELLLDRLADGWSADDLMVSYPRLTLTDIQAVFALAAELLREEEYVALSKAS